MPETFTSADAVDLAVVDRNGFVESRHQGTAVVVGPGGDVLLELGDGAAPVFPRSTLKPFQALASMQSGVPLRGAEVALACASHVGSREHMDLAASMLAKAGLDESALRCPEAWPQHEATRTELVRSGAARSRLAFNCSGKHAAFLWACTENGWDTESYLDPGHPLQRRVVEVVEEYADERIAHLAVDGCGAPVPAISLRGLARATSRLSRSPGNKASDARATTIATAMLDYPWAVHGHGEENTVVMEETGVIAKLGAEGVLILGAPDGTACALKMLDGNGRAATLVGLTLLAAAGALDTRRLSTALELTNRPVLGGGQAVGRIRLAAPVVAVLD
ncbi:asparaginase [Zafaria sp. Z1313]|uniref:asparaginase n=1 Tax=unclassified Zafaria TaxID=2828765 RepID=UPI002E7829D0|nr:asparaginase [Zafaria sp. J156]MEE1621375.1 asparaginase [Zafaria sp. J156]